MREHVFVKISQTQDELDLNKIDWEQCTYKNFPLQKRRRVRQNRPVLATIHQRIQGSILRETTRAPSRSRYTTQDRLKGQNPQSETYLPVNTSRR